MFCIRVFIEGSGKRSFFWLRVLRSFIFVLRRVFFDGYRFYGEW